MRLTEAEIDELERLYPFASKSEQEFILELLREQAGVADGQQGDVRFVDYVRATVDFELEDWQVQFCEILQDAADNPGRKIIIHKPPQMGGTVLASQRWGSWLIGRNPLHRHVGVSYSMQQAGDVFGFGIRNNLLSDAHLELFPGAGGMIDKRSSMEGFRTHARSALNDTQFSFLAVGVQSGVVGKGFDCIAEGTLVRTSIGDIPIESMEALAKDAMILGYDTVNERATWRKLRGFQAKTGTGMVEIATSGGRTLRCTPDHRIFVQGAGYKSAENLAPGDRVVVTPQDPHGQGVSWLSGSDQGGLHLPAVLPKSEGGAARGARLPVVQASVPAEQMRAGQIDPQVQSDLVQPGLQPCVPGRPGPTQMQPMRTANATRSQMVLLDPVQGNSQGQPTQTSFADLWRMRIALRRAQHPLGLLRARLRRQGTLATDDRCGEFAPQEGHELCQVVPRNAPDHHRTGRTQVHGLQSSNRTPSVHQARGREMEGQSACPSYRSRSAQQSPREPDLTLQALPQSAPSVGTDTVAMVRHLRDGSYNVYDIEVEGTHNFFAGGVLVHNCVVVDDPYGSPENAVSPSINEKVARFMTQALGPRITEKTTVVCMFHRYSLNDVAQRLLDTGEYEYHRFAMVADDNPDGSDPTGRKPGEMLSPRRTREWAEKIEREDLKLYMSQLQGLPLAASAQIINPDSFRPWEGERPKVKFWYRGYDLALVEHTPDETASVLMGMTEDGEILIDDVQHWRKDIRATEDKILENVKRDPPGTFVCLYNEVTHLSTISRLKLHEHVRVIEVKRANRDKYACAAGWVAQADRGRVFFSRSCSESSYFKVQCANFANEKLDRDDLIDAFSAAYESTHRHRATRKEEPKTIHPDSFAYLSALIGRGRQAARAERARSAPWGRR